MVGTLIRRPPFVSDFMKTMLDDTTASGALATLGITNSTYVPTLFNTTNVDASTAFSSTYLQVLGVVFVFGRVDIDPTVTATATTLGMSIPIPSNFALSEHLGGVAAAGGLNSAIRITAETTNDRANFVFVSASAANLAYNFLFAYRVI